MNRHIAPSILAADFTRLGEAVATINNSKASWLHCDIMDGVFVPNVSFGMPVLEAVHNISTKPLDVHLMIVEPERYIDRFCALGADVLTLHQEASRHLHRAVHQIKENGVKAGISLNPATPVSTLADIVQDLDLVLIMSVNPGFGGQKFIERSYQRIAELKELIEKTHSKALIEVDGGVNLENAASLFAAGADVLVAGTSVFHTSDPAYTIEQLLKA